MKVLILAALVAVSAARPRFLVIPLEDVEFQMMPSPGILRPPAATPTLPLTHPRAPTTLTTERTPAATVPSAGTPTTLFSLVDITKPPYFSRSSGQPMYSYSY